MTDFGELSRELDRLITLGHQDASLLTALRRKFPELSQTELEAGFDKVIADRGLKPVREQES
ncbi:hypothetical protein [Hyphomicrobium sp. LHD-15]|uniref:hypothetical protein n=1 Tax=Hyphomicrobium sp. LHD-15 TaxID=3072142 RepID=UPI00280E563D|nr:hypothetical protein [Hyphomicrobium sp. LHD-15]MDQ8698236.1 hypothetical protein [Hyphomicrobium sp. LHD-15]